MLDALIVGAGPVGLTMGTMLHRQGVSFRIIDKAAEASDKSKALVVWSRSLELLQKAGLSETFVKRGHMVHSASIYANGKRVMHNTMERIDSPFTNVLMIAQNETEAILTEHLAAAGHAIERAVELVSFKDDGDGVECVLRKGDATETVRAKYLLGCDGAHSTVRHQLGFEFLGHTLTSTWALADVDIEGLDHDDELLIFWNSDGIMALFPMGSENGQVRARIIVNVDNKFEGDALTIEHMQGLVDRWVARAWKLHNPRWLAYFTINERKVKEYSRGRVFLAGDAAHIHSPAGGQGMNTGMQDACNLAWKLAAVLRGESAPALLDSYSAERSVVGDEIVRNADRLTTAATMRGTIKQAVRNHLVAALTSLGPVKQKIVDQMAEVTIGYPKSPIVGEHRDLMAWLVSHGPKPGMRAPEAHLTENGADTSLFSVLCSTRHVALLLGGLHTTDDGRAALNACADLLAARCGEHVDVVAIGVDAPPQVKGARSLIDPHGAMHRLYGAGQSTVYVIRPDGYVGFRSQPADRASLETWLAQIFLELSASVK